MYTAKVPTTIVLIGFARELGWLPYMKKRKEILLMIPIDEIDMLNGLNLWFDLYGLIMMNAFYMIERAI